MFGCSTDLLNTWIFIYFRVIVLFIVNLTNSLTTHLATHLFYSSIAIINHRNSHDAMQSDDNSKNIVYLHDEL